MDILYGYSLLLCCSAWLSSAVRSPYSSLPSQGLTGQIPDGIGEMTALSTIDLNNNNITGTLPNSVGMLKKLVTLDVSFNKLGGTLSPSLQLATSLKVLKLNNNRYALSIHSLM